jgi:hypothetical protein
MIDTAVNDLYRVGAPTGVGVTSSRANSSAFQA